MSTGDRRHFGPGTLAALVVANMIGAGVFTTSGFTLALAVLAASRQPVEWLAAGITVASGLVVWWGFRRGRPRP